MILTLVFCHLLFHEAFAKEFPLEHRFAVDDDDNGNDTWNNVDLGPRHRIKDSNYLLDRYPIGELSPDVSMCRRTVKCVPLHKNTCMGTKLPYTTTTLDLVPERVTQRIIEVDKNTVYT